MTDDIIAQIKKLWKLNCRKQGENHIRVTPQLNNLLWVNAYKYITDNNNKWLILKFKRRDLRWDNNRKSYYIQAMLTFFSTFYVFINFLNFHNLCIKTTTKNTKKQQYKSICFISLIEKIIYIYICIFDIL